MRIPRLLVILFRKDSVSTNKGDVLNSGIIWRELRDENFIRRNQDSIPYSIADTDQ